MRGAGWPGTVQTRVDGVCNWQRSVRGRPGLWTRRRVGRGQGRRGAPSAAVWTGRPASCGGRVGPLVAAAVASGLLVNVNCAPFLVLIGCSAAGALLFLLAWAAVGGGGGLGRLPTAAERPGRRAQPPFQPPQCAWSVRRSTVCSFIFCQCPAFRRCVAAAAGACLCYRVVICRAVCAVPRRLLQ